MWGIWTGYLFFRWKICYLNFGSFLYVEESFTIKNEGAKKMTAGMRLRSTLLDCQ